jgi:hypothetical protein
MRVCGRSEEEAFTSLVSVAVAGVPSKRNWWAKEVIYGLELNVVIGNKYHLEEQKKGAFLSITWRLI